VLAHELSHVAHRDVAVMTFASFLGVLAGSITRMALWSGMMRGAGRNQNTAILAILIPLVSAVVYVISFLLTRLLSRYRELSADRGAALLTGRPSALSSALTKITGRWAMAALAEVVRIAVVLISDPPGSLQLSIRPAKATSPPQAKSTNQNTASAAPGTYNNPIAASDISTTTARPIHTAR
jgi:Zn-dependent protease with chaperone function